MSSQLKIQASAPGEATIILIGKAMHYGEDLTISFPQFSSISSQKVLQQGVDGENLLLTIDADSLGDILEPDSPYQIKIPELETVGVVIWPEIIGKRGASKGIINTARPTPPKASPVIEKEEEFFTSMAQEQTTSLPSSLVRDSGDYNSKGYIGEVEQQVPLVSEDPKKQKTFLPVMLLSIAGIVILLAGGAIAYIQFSQPHSEPLKEQIVKKEEPTKVTENKPAAPPVQPPKPETSFAETLQKMSVPDVINKAPNTAMITKEAERRLEAKQFDDGVLLLENAVSKGDLTAMLKLGLLYSPVDFKAGGAIPSPDMREAARYLQQADEGGLKEAQAPRAALKDWLTKKADGGDDMARLTLKDFWK